MTLHGFPGLGDRAALLRGAQLRQRGHEVQLPVQVWKKELGAQGLLRHTVPGPFRGPTSEVSTGPVVGLGGFGQEAPAVCAHLVEAVTCKSQNNLKTSCEVWGDNIG